MEGLLEYWFLFPVGLVISFTYATTGISGATFWTPIYVLGMGIEATVALWMSLVTVLVGSTGGVFSYYKMKTIRWHLVRKYLMVTLPFALLGALTMQVLSTEVLLLIFGVMVIAYGVYLLYHDFHGTWHHPKTDKIHHIHAAIGAFSTGLVSTGVGKMILPKCRSHKDCLTHLEAVGTTVTIVFITSLVSALARLHPGFLEAMGPYSHQVVSMALFAIPGVIIGGILGPMLTHHKQFKRLHEYVGGVVIIVGLIMLGRGVLHLI